MRWLPVVRWTCALVILAAAAWISVDMVRDAYGAGAPYYGRTVNMDKWASPWPTLAAIDGIAVVLALLIAPWRRKPNNFL